ncbi:ketopantoate reductase family protein [Staphylococcus caprae]|uniref:ketopantoate reductase family protein n=1 Tax=Staphylococcus caprae TaxID=29380 RepID=UPI003B212419
MKIAIYGAGSLGTIMGAFLSESNPNVDLIDVNEAHVNELNNNGAHIVGKVDYSQNVKALTPSQINDKYDIVLLLTKQVFNKDVLPTVKEILKDDGVLVSLQNGVPEEFIQQTIPKEQIVAGSVEFGATFEGPGKSKLTTEFESFKENAIQIGELNGEITERIQNIQKALSPIGGISISENLPGTKWAKLIINSAFSGMSAATGGTYGDVVDNDTGAKAALYAINEVINVGKSAGIEFVRLSVLDYKYFEEITNVEKQIDEMREMIKHSRSLEASMLQDLQKQRPTEIDYINGIVTKLGKENNVNTPVNDLIVEIVSDAQNQKTVPDFNESIEKFKSVVE